MTSPAGTVLVTGGTGYIGSHTIVQLVEEGWQVVAVDDRSNSRPEVVLERIAELTGKPEAVSFVELDLRDERGVAKLFAEHRFDAVIHFAGYKSVKESCEDPLLYYSNNLKGAIVLLEAMKRTNVKTLVFSSSCTVYGSSPSPLTEDSPVGIGITNAYARCKRVVEELLRDMHSSDPSWSVCILRYFNPVGAHPSGRIGEDPLGVPNCVMPFIFQVLAGRRPHLTLFGDDYPTRDGTAIRDYLHVEDVARGHIDALRWLRKGKEEGSRDSLFGVFNFGRGEGTTVRELIKAVEEATGRTVPVVVGPRREGDLAESYCDPGKALAVLGWRAEKGLKEICEDAWRFQLNNPEGYEARR